MSATWACPFFSTVRIAIPGIESSFNWLVRRIPAETGAVAILIALSFFLYATGFRFLPFAGLAMTSEARTLMSGTGFVVCERSHGVKKKVAKMKKNLTVGRGKIGIYY